MVISGDVQFDAEVGTWVCRARTSFPEQRLTPIVHTMGGTSR